MHSSYFLHKESELLCLYYGTNLILLGEGVEWKRKSYKLLQKGLVGGVDVGLRYIEVITQCRL